MKTKEFNRIVASLGYYPEHHDHFISVREAFTGEVKCTINKVYQDSLNLNTANLELSKLCIEYAETPLHEREDVKKYVVVIQDKENESKERVYALAKVNDGRVMINRPKIKDLRQNERYHLTEEEIKRNHSYLWQFAEEVK